MNASVAVRSWVRASFVSGPYRPSTRSSIAIFADSWITVFRCMSKFIFAEFTSRPRIKADIVATHPTANFIESRVSALSFSCGMKRLMVRPRTKAKIRRPATIRGVVSTLMFEAEIGWSGSQDYKDRPTSARDQDTQHVIH